MEIVMIFEIVGIVILAIMILYLLAIMPKLRRNPNSKKLDGWLYAHRGLHDNKSDTPENSLRAFALAVEKGYGIELDVQLTKDKIPVILHDYNLKRACNVDYKISEHNYEELADFRLFESEEKIPTLQEALAVVGGKVPLIIELKIPWKAEKICSVVSGMLRDYKGIYCIESFNPLGLRWYRVNEPKVVRGQLSTDFLRDKIEGNKFQYFILKHLLLNFYTKPDFIAYHHIYKKGLSFILCRTLYRAKTVAWTIQSKQDYEENQKYFELFIFDSFIPQDKKADTAI
jgi:glycerophosphoryl diester phosphodiesterase